MEQEKLINFITGDPDEAEFREILEWINASPDNRKEYFRLKNIYALSKGDAPVPELWSDYLKVKSKLNLNSKETTIRWIRESLKYAAVIAVTLLSVYFYSQLRKPEIPREYVTSFHQLTVPFGQISEFIFADGTRVWLNSGTDLRFPENPRDSLREVYLEGEAYFEVSRNKEKPFIVHAGNQKVRVLGTSFNVRAYEGTENIETTLIDGSVTLENNQTSEKIVMAPGDQYLFSRVGGANLLRKVDTRPYQAWKNGKLIFRNKSLGEIAGDLERWYNVKITFADEQIRDFHFTGTILKYKPVDQILEAIKLTSPIRYKIRVDPERSSEIVLYKL